MLRSRRNGVLLEFPKFYKAIKLLDNGEALILCDYLYRKKNGVLLLEYVQNIRGLFLFPVFFILEINLYMCKYGLANFWKVSYNSYVFFFFPSQKYF